MHHQGNLLGFAGVFNVFLYRNAVQEESVVETISVNKFRENLKGFVEQVVTEHEPLKVSRRAGDDFVVISAEDWEREQESLYVLQNTNLMQQIAESISTHSLNNGYQATEEQLDEITSL